MKRKRIRCDASQPQNSWRSSRSPHDACGCAPFQIDSLGSFHHAAAHRMMVSHTKFTATIFSEAEHLVTQFIEPIPSFRYLISQSDRWKKEGLAEAS